MNQPNKIVLHCSDSDYAHHDDISVITDWHLERTPPIDPVGYNYFIKRNGEIQEGRPLEVAPAAHSPWNKNSIAICMHGKETFYYPQYLAQAELVTDLMISYNIPLNRIYGHYEVPGVIKTCPNYETEDFIEYYLKPYINDQHPDMAVNIS